MGSANIFRVLGTDDTQGSWECSSGSRLLAWNTPGPSTACGKPGALVCRTPGTGEVERRRPDLHGPRLHSEARLDDGTSLFPKRNNEEEEKEERSMAHLGDREHIYLLGADNTLQQKKRWQLTWRHRRPREEHRGLVSYTSSLAEVWDLG